MRNFYYRQNILQRTSWRGYGETDINYCRQVIARVRDGIQKLWTERGKYSLDESKIFLLQSTIGDYAVAVIHFG